MKRPPLPPVTGPELKVLDELWQPIRAAVTGSNISPPLPESLELLGRDRTVERLRRAAG